jgi:hypothetical protein
MRMRQEKIQDLASRVTELLRQNSQVEFLASESAVRVAIGSAIRDDLEEEDEIDREVEELLNRHARQIENEDMDLRELRLKFKRQIARQRGFII